MRAPGLLLALLCACSGTAPPGEGAPFSRGAPAVVTGDDGLPVAPDAHLLLITVDALRADHLGAYGYTRGITPELDRLAAGAVVFERAYAQAPHSSYSISTLMTSQYVHELAQLHRPLPEATLASSLHAAGRYTEALYTDGIFYTDGDVFAGYAEGAFGFDVHDGRGRRAEGLTDAALDAIDRIVDEGELPSLLWVHYFDTHEPYRDTSLGTAALDRYDGELAKVDAQVGRLVREARARLSRPVVLVLTADHGEEFRDHGGVSHGSKLYEEQIRVPLWVQAPGLAPRRVSPPVQLLDLAPTLIALMGARVPSSMRGDDLRPLLVGREMDPGPVFAAVARRRAVVSWPMKLLLDPGSGRIRLFDLSVDPGERHDLGRERVGVGRRLQDAVDGWLDGVRGGLDAVRAAPEGGRAAGRVPPAIDLGRLGDRRAVAGLRALLTDRATPDTTRCDAARVLGDLHALGACDDLAATIRSAPGGDPLRAEAAIALGLMRDRRARGPLVSLLLSQDEDLRARVALALGRLRSPAAVPALIEVVGSQRPAPMRKSALASLGRMRDARAFEALLRAAEKPELSYRAICALGLLGDRRAYDPLVAMLETAPRTMIRDGIARSFGWLGARRALPRLLDMSRDQPELIFVSESLVRLGAVGLSIGGVDVGPGTAGMARCHRGDPLAARYRGLRYCESRGGGVELSLQRPSGGWGEGDALLLIRLRVVGQRAEVRCSLRAGDATLGTFRAGTTWKEHRLRVPADRLGVRVTLLPGEPDARLALDHLLVVPAR